MSKINRKKYGVISDIHLNPSMMTPIVNRLKSEGVDALVLNGDIGNDLESIDNTLDKATSLGVETYVQPGSHERLEDYFPVLEKFLNKKSNLVNVLKDSKIEFSDHHLVFLPGSDYRSGGEFALESFDGSNGGLCKTPKGDIYITNINSLDSMVTDPEKTIVFCHVPRKFYNPKICVDHAHFGQLKNGDIYPKPIVEEIVKNKFGKHMAEDRIEEHMGAFARDFFGISLKRENRGNTDLKLAYERNGITKAISGHFHESSHRANDSKSRYVSEDFFTDDLFYNSGAADDGLAGIVNVVGNKIAYKNIVL